MGDEKHGLLWVCRKETVIQFALGGFVEGAADLVEQQDVATVEQSAGDGDTLRLALAESAAALTQFGVDAVGQVKDEVSTGGMQHLAQFVFGGVRLCQLQVIADGAAHQGIALWHETQFTAHRDLSACRLDKSKYQSEHRRLTDARLAHDGGLGACLELMREVGKYLPVALGIAERDIFETDALRTCIAISCNSRCLRSLFQFTESVNARRRVNDSWHHVQQLQYRVLYHAYQLQERGHDAEGDGAVAQSDAAPHEGQQIAQSEGAAHDEPCDDGEPHAPHHVAAQPLLHRVEAVGHPLFRTQRAQHGVMLHALLHLHLDAALVLSDVECHLPQSAGNQFSEYDDQRREQQQRPCQPFVKPPHQQEGAAELDAGNHHLGQRVGAYRAHLLDILRQSRGHIARVQRVAVVEPPAEQAAEDAQPQGVRLTDTGGGGQPVAHLPQYHTAHDGQHQHRDHAQHIVSRPRADGLVDEPAAEPYHQQAEHYLPDACHDAHRRIPADASRVTPQPRDIFHSTTSTFCHSAIISATSALASSAVTSYSSQSFSASASTVKSPIA